MPLVVKAAMTSMIINLGQTPFSAQSPLLGLQQQHPFVFRRNLTTLFYARGSERRRGKRNGIFELTKKLQETFLARCRRILPEEVEAWNIWRRLWNNALAIVGPVL